jgi:hypothetical protein
MNHLTVELHSKQEAVEIVEKWLQEEQYEVSLVPDENADNNFMIVKGYMVSNVGFHKRSIDSLIVGGKIRFNPEEQSIINILQLSLNCFMILRYYVHS